jgi:hypothetical protein
LGDGNTKFLQPILEGEETILQRFFTKRATHSPHEIKVVVITYFLNMF